MRNYTTGILKHDEGLLCDRYVTILIVSRSWLISNDWSCIGQTFDWERPLSSHSLVWSCEYQFQQSSAETKQKKRHRQVWRSLYPQGWARLQESMEKVHKKVHPRKFFSLREGGLMLVLNSLFSQFTRPTTILRICHPLPSSSTMSYKTAVEEYGRILK